MGIVGNSSIHTHHLVRGGCQVACQEVLYVHLMYVPTNPPSSSCPSPYKEIRQVGQWANSHLCVRFRKPLATSAVSEMMVKPNRRKPATSCKSIQGTALVLLRQSCSCPTHIGQSLVCPLSGGFSCSAEHSHPHSIYTAKLVHCGHNPFRRYYLKGVPLASHKGPHL